MWATAERGRYPGGIVGRTVADRVCRVEHSTAIAAVAEMVVMGPDDDVLVGQLAAGNHAENIHRRTLLEVAGTARLIGEHRIGECRQLLGEVCLRQPPPVGAVVATRELVRRQPADDRRDVEAGLGRRHRDGGLRRGRCGRWGGGRRG